MLEREAIMSVWQGALSAGSTTIMVSRNTVREIVQECPACPASPLLRRLCDVGDWELVLVPASAIAELCEYWLNQKADN